MRMTVDSVCQEAPHYPVEALQLPSSCLKSPWTWVPVSCDASSNWITI